MGVGTSVPATARGGGGTASPPSGGGGAPPGPAGAAVGGGPSTASVSVHSASSDLTGDGSSSASTGGAGGSGGKTPHRTSSALDLPSVAAASGASGEGDVIVPHLTRDLPHHILECPLLPGSGRTMRSYRMRHANSGASIVIRSTVIRYLPDDSPNAAAGAYPTESKFVADVTAQEHELARIKALIGDPTAHPNVLPFLAWSASTSPTRDYRSNLTVRALYLARGHLHSTLADRLATRPFLSGIEKHWTSYQILRALDGLHGAGVCHGHLTCENVGVTSWGWVVITDVASYKPVSIPGDDPSEFIAHFQERSAADAALGASTGAAGGSAAVGASEERRGGHGERQRCYLSPERFYTKRRANDPDVTADPADRPALHLTPAMDVFSAGCVLVELYLNGERALDLGDVMELRARGEGSHTVLKQRLGKIESSSMRAACRHMLNVDPDERLSAAEYLERLSRDPAPSSKSKNEAVAKAKAATTTSKAPVPPCFDGTLFPLLKRLRTESLGPDARIALAAAHYGRVVRETVGVDDKWGESYFRRLVGETVYEMEHQEDNGAAPPSSSSSTSSEDETKKRGAEATGHAPPPVGETDALLEETEELLRRLESSSLFAEGGDAPTEVGVDAEEKKADDDPEADSGPANNDSEEVPDDLELQFRKVSSTWPSPSSPPPSAAALVVYVNLLLSSIRHVQRPPSKLAALLLLNRLAVLSTDDIRLQRIVPCAASLLSDSDGMVRAEALRLLTFTLERTEDFPPSDAQLFPRYVFKRIGTLASDPALPVRLAFAGCVARLAETARRFLDISHAKRLYEVVGAAEEAEKKGDKCSDTSEGAGATSGSSSPTKAGQTGVGAGAGSGGGMFSDDLADLLGGGSSTEIKPTVVKIPPANADAKQAGDGVPGKKDNGEDSSGAEDKGKGARVTTLIESTYDADLAALRTTVSQWVVQLATDVDSVGAAAPSATGPDSPSASASFHTRSSEPKKVLLRSLPSLASFFGRDGVLAFVLPQALAFLNDRTDPALRAELCLRLPDVCGSSLGRAATDQFVVPCVETALVDEESCVVASALGCVARLVRLGLLTRGALLGADPGRVASSDASGGGSGAAGMGMIERCAPLLIHPSALVRGGAAALLAASCVAVGFPDDEVFVLPLVRPFFRYEPTREQLRSKRGITLCLLPPLTRKVMHEEFEKLREMSAPGQTPVQVRNDAASAATLTGAPDGVLDGGVDEGAGARGAAATALMRQYLQNLYRRNRFGNPFEDDDDVVDDGGRNGDHRASASGLDAALTVDGNGAAGSASSSFIKPAYSCSVPNQKFAELVKHSLPEWYGTMRRLHADNPADLSEEICSLRSLSSLNQVYGLNVSQSTNSFDPKRGWKGDSAYAFLDMMLDDGIPADADGSVTKEDATAFLSSVESKTFEAALDGEWGSSLKLDPALLENSLHATKLRALAMPPLPPRLGLLRERDGRPFSWHGSLASASDSTAADGETSSPRGEWKPKMDALVASSAAIGEHGGAAVARLAVSQDQTFFASAGHDGTSRVWELRQVQDSAGDLHSCQVYGGHNGGGGRTCRINDVAVIENSHSVATAASNGSVHVWRVDMVSARASAHSSNQGDTGKGIPESSKYYDRSRVSGTSLVRDIDPDEGEALAISHFNTSSSSVVMFGTQKGFIHSWDLRSAKEPFCLKIRPELGYLTSMAVGHDRNWAVAGTNHGCLALFDLRFAKIVNLWQHSSAAPIARIATSSSTLPQAGGDAVPSVFLGSGLNEAASFDLLEGKCRQCFRVLDTDLSYVDQSSMPPSCLTLPSLSELPIPSQAHRRIYSVQQNGRRSLHNRPHTPEPSILSLMGRVGSSGHNYLITGGSDCCIRYWDFSSPSRCYTVSGLVNSQPRPVYESVDTANHARLFLCRQMPVPRLSEVENSKIPRKLQRGACRPDVYSHRDAILDIKMVEFPMQGLLSCSRDGAIKLWR